jgi:hypothetical protein
MSKPVNRQQAIIDLCQEYDLALLYLFGSQSQAVWQWFTTNELLSLMAGHDVDVGVKSLPGRELTVRQKVELAQTLESLLNAPQVDLVCLEDADPFLAVNIIRGERLYAADNHAADEYELYLLRRAGDLAPFERARITAVMGASGA